MRALTQPDQRRHDRADPPLAGITALTQEVTGAAQRMVAGPRGAGPEAARRRWRARWTTHPEAVRPVRAGDRRTATRAAKQLEGLGPPGRGGSRRQVTAATADREQGERAALVERGRRPCAASPGRRRGRWPDQGETRGHGPGVGRRTATRRRSRPSQGRPLSTLTRAQQRRLAHRGCAIRCGSCIAALGQASQGHRARIATDAG